ncbi:MAG: peptidase, partial [Nitrosopumilaceae archaeon]
MSTSIILPIILSFVVGLFLIPSAYAQFQAGGVDVPGEWFAGEGLKQGDLFSYSICHVDYKECTEFEMDFWIKGEKQVGSEAKWLAEVVVYDGSKLIKGEMELGKLAPEPTGGSTDLGVYRGAFKSSVVWLSAFATGYDEGGKEGPKKFSDKSWGKIGNIGGEQVVPTALETITTPAGTFDTVLITWKTGGATSKVWILDDFPFPVKASTLTHVSEGIPPPEYKFELLNYEENIQSSPFDDIVPTDQLLEELGCETHYEKVSVKKPTKNFDYQVHVFYGPENPIQGCPMDFLIKFISKYDDTEFLNQVQFDFLVVNENLEPLRSLAQEDNKNFLYSPSGQTQVDFTVQEEPGIAHYVIWIYGLSPEEIVPSSSPDYLQLDIPISSSSGGIIVEPT